jgi:tRNA modification GTPase
VILIDTAGLREAAGAIEAEGIKRALARAQSADLVLWLIDATAPVPEPPSALANGAAPLLRVINKADVNPSLTIMNAPAISASTGAGIDDLVEALTERAREGLNGGAGGAVVTRARHRAELQESLVALRRSSEPGLPEDLKAEELRIAALHLGRLTGRVDVEEVLGAIFSEFCIGK